MFVARILRSSLQPRWDKMIFWMSGGNEVKCGSSLFVVLSFVKRRGGGLFLPPMIAMVLLQVLGLLSWVLGLNIVSISFKHTSNLAMQKQMRVRVQVRVRWEKSIGWPEKAVQIPTWRLSAERAGFYLLLELDMCNLLWNRSYYGIWKLLAVCPHATTLALGMLNISLGINHCYCLQSC